MLFRKKPSRPTAVDVAERLIVLQCVVVHSLATPPEEVRMQLARRGTKEDLDRLIRLAEEQRDAHWDQLRQAGLWSYLSPWELAHASTTNMTMPDEARVSGLWRLEALNTLAWALRIVPQMPSCDQTATPEFLQYLSSSEAAPLITLPQLRDQASLEKARDLAEFWHWRSRTRELIERGDPFPADAQFEARSIRKYDDIIRRSAKVGEEKGDFVAIDQDFPAKGKAYRDLTAEEWADVRSITMERHFALNWLCGYAPGNRWDETPTET